MKKLPFLILALFLLSSILLSASAAASPSAKISPALDYIASHHKMIKTGLVYGDIRFTEADFKQALGVSSVPPIKIVSLPPASDGSLKIANDNVIIGDVISKNDIALLRFVPASPELRQSSFGFSAGSGGEISCVMYVINEINYAPTVNILDTAKLTVKTISNIPVYSSLSAVDPEGDALVYEIINYPSHGGIELLDASFGDYKFTPADNYIGKDSFTYVVRDKYGNYSNAATVNVVVGDGGDEFAYADMEEHWARGAALSVSKSGLMSGISDGGVLFFEPDSEISRADFLVAVMRAANVAPASRSDLSSFSDAAYVPVGERLYMTAAVEKGYIEGRDGVGGSRLLCPNDSITRAEAAVIVCRIIDAATPTLLSVFSDDREIAVWAKDAIYTLNSLGIMNGTGEGCASPNMTVTRAQTAQILCSVIDR